MPQVDVLDVPQDSMDVSVSPQTINEHWTQNNKLIIVKISQVDFLWHRMLGCWCLIIVSVDEIYQFHIYISWWGSRLSLGYCSTSVSTFIPYFLMLTIEFLTHLTLYCDYIFVGSQGKFSLQIDVNIPVHYYYICSSLDVIDKMHI